jgi:type I restriction enzyme, S subunit
MRHCRWGDVCTLEYGKALRDYPNEPSVESPFQVFGTNGPIGWTSKALADGPGVIVGRKGAYRGVHYSPSAFFVIDTAYYLRPLSDDVDLRWAYYKLLTVDINRIDVGAAIPTTSRDAFYAVPVTIPPLETQKAAAAILSAYDDLIENNRRRMALLEESARLLYREWFVRLRFPGHEHTTIVNGLPEGWERLTIGDHVESGAISLQTGPFGTQLRASDYVEAGTPVINVRNIGYGDLRPDKLESVPEGIVERLGVHVLQAGDIVFGRKGAVDRHLLISPAQAGWMQGSDCIRLRVVNESVCPVFLSFAFREEGHRQWMLNQCGSKATMASLNQEVIARIPVLQPKATLVAEFRGFTDAVATQMVSLQRQSDLAARARDLLLPRLMSGEISV